MTNTGSAFRFSPVLALRAGESLAEWPEFGPLLVAPFLTPDPRPGYWAALVFDAETLHLPAGAEVRVP